MQANIQSTSAEGKKKNYCKPELQEWGSLTFLTKDRGNTQPFNDTSRCGSVEIPGEQESCLPTPTPTS
jgi:hypothetical protein